MAKDIVVIGIDHGWSHMKTSSKIFTSGVESNPSPTFYKDVLEYEGRYYSVGGSRLEVKDTKVENEDFYLLTLAAVAKELESRGDIREADVYLAAGLPLTRFGEEKQEFIDYLGKNGEVTFRYSEKEYHIRIVKVSVYPQCYSAVADMIPDFQRKVVVIDIGSWTVDIMPVVGKRPDDARCNSLPHGLITCMKDINRACIKQFNFEMDEMDIEHYIRYHQLSNQPERVVGLVDQKLREYAEAVYRSLKEQGINVQSTPIIFVGGGAVLMKTYCEGWGTNVRYKLDVKANARGYEAMAKASLGSRRRLF